MSVAAQRWSAAKRPRRDPAGRGQTTARLAAIAELKELRAAHRAAKERWIAGDRDVVFPGGTYWMRVHHGARVASFD